MAFILSTRSKNNLKGVHPSVVKVISEAIVESPYDFVITSGVRTATQQNALYQQGRNGNPGKRVTNADGYKNKSNHQPKSDGFGHAIDIALCGVVIYGKYIKYKTGEAMYDSEKMKVVADHIKAIAKKLDIKIEWGGDWKGKLVDSPHYQLSK